VAGPAGDDALVLEGVSVRFGAILALAPLSLRLGAGATCLVTGPNGSGKSTLLRVAAGLCAPSTGTRRAPGAALYLRTGSGARDVQTVEEAVAFAARASGSRIEVGRLLATVDLVAAGARVVGTLSAGQRARVTLAVALAACPSLVCLDEPLAHLDAAGADATARALRALTTSGSAVLLATQESQTAGLPHDALIELQAGRLVGPA
jgi:ABC-type multidrug transport system ATPase subunit